MVNNIIKFPTKTNKTASSDEKKVQGTECFKQVITSDLREQLRNESRSKHGYIEPKTT